MSTVAEISQTLVLHTRVITGAGGGPDKTILNSPRMLTDSPYDVRCAYMRPPGDEAFESVRVRAKRASAPLIEIDDRGAVDWRVARDLVRLCKQQRVSIWHGHDYKSNLLGVLVRRFWPMQLVSTVHGWVEKTWRTPLYYRLDRWSLRHYDQVVCVSEDLLNTCVESGIRTERCHLIENAIDTDMYRRQKTTAAAKSELGWPEQRKVVGAVGRLSTEKGFDQLIVAIESLIRDGLDVSLKIVGDGPQREDLQAMIDSQGLEDRIELLGFQEDLIRIYQAFDVFALSSIREGLPNVVLEAMALEVPIVATRIAGIPRLVQHEETGLLVEPGRPSQLADSIKRVLTTPTLAEDLTRQGRSRIESDYSFRERMRKMRAVYDRVTGNTSAEQTKPLAEATAQASF